MIDYITIRNFYPDPYAIRDYAFEQEYHQRHQSLEGNQIFLVGELKKMLE